MKLDPNTARENVRKMFDQMAEDSQRRMYLKSLKEAQAEFTFANVKALNDGIDPATYLELVAMGIANFAINAAHFVGGVPNPIIIMVLAAMIEENLAQTATGEAQPFIQVSAATGDRTV